MAVVPEKVTLMNPRPALGSAVLFHAGGRAYTVDDAISSGMFRGELDTAIEETLALSAAEDRAGEEGFEPDDDALQASSENFRYQHDLITAGETEGWLESRGMTIDDLSRHLYQQLCREALPAEADGKSVPDDLSDLLRVNLWMTDAMDELAAQLRRRIAAGIEMSDRETLSTQAEKRRFLGRHRLDDRSLQGWLAVLNRDDAWLAEALRVETAFDRLITQAITDDARSRKLASMGLALSKMEIETLELDSEAAAREAVLCVRDDGESLSELARASGYHADRSEIWTDDLDDTIGQRLLGAADGEVIGPVESDDRFKVYQIVRKIEPRLADPAVSDRIDKAIVDEFFDDLCARHTHASDVARTGQ
jgi:hypothetical protein